MKWVVCLPFELPWEAVANTHKEVEQQVLSFIGADSIPSGTVIVEGELEQFMGAER